MMRSCKLLLAGFLLIFSIGAVSAETPANITDDELRAAYLSSVVRYVRWPDETNRTELTIGILGAPSVYASMNETQLPNIRGMQLRVREMQRATQASEVDIVFVVPRTSTQLASVFTSLRNQPILVISEGGVTRDDVMINLIPSRQNRLAFQVNNDRISAQGLQPSADLLMLRGVELEMVVAYRSLQQEQQGYLEQLAALEEQITQQEQQNRQLRERISILELTVQERDSVLAAQAGTLEDKQLVMESQQATLNRLLQELDEQRQRLFTREEQLAIIQQSLRTSQIALEQQQRQLEEKEVQLQQKQQESDALAERIARNRNVLAAQQQQLRDQREAIAEQLALLESREQTISRQRDYLWFVGIGFFIALVFALLSISLYYYKRRTAAELMRTLQELNDAQDKLVESEKMAALGNLVAGVAHEVNTPLGVALTATSMLNDRREQLKEFIEEGQLTREHLNNFVDKAEESLNLTEKNLSRVARLISNFKQVAVDQMVAERREIDLREYLEEILSTLSIELRRAKVSYRIVANNDIRMVTIPGAMAQIMTNLTTNAIRHAFESSEGTITIEATVVEGDQIRIRFSDDGAGMDADTLQRIFEPFFTTKRNDGGTGLGMPIVYNLVRQKLQGDISVKSELGAGTSFTLLLPRTLRGGVNG
ncbi:MAG: DUF4154 domain-containing protein [Idiomarina sp.]|nr:DUF4154 domain-containing protein [Idiomarina sp.]